MTAHISSSGIARYLARTLPPADILALHLHLEACPACRQALESAVLAQTPSLTLPLLCDPVDPHLGEEEMVAFVAASLPEPRLTEAANHLAACEICRDSVADMESVRREPAIVPPRRRTARWIFLGGAIAAALLVSALVYRSSHTPPAPTAVLPAHPVLASLRDGARTLQLDPTGALRGLDGASPEEQSLVRNALLTRALPAGPSLSVQAPGVLLSSGSPAQPPFAPLGPLDKRVLSDRPVFTWQPDPGASAYQVLVTRETLDPVARSPRIAATDWQPESPLPRGVILLWQVRAWHGAEIVNAPAPPAPPARFEIASQPIADRLEQLRTSPNPSHLLAAVLCAREGLRDEAARELQILARENPNSPLIPTLR